VIGLAGHINFIADWFRAISKEAGYQTDLGAVVSTERISGNGEDRKMAAAVLLTKLTSVKRTAQRRDWEFEVIASVRVPTNASSSEKTSIAVLEDLNRAVPTSLALTPEGLFNVEITDAEIMRPVDGANYNVVGVTLRATCFEYTKKPA
jgi:hypothetical protein